MNIFSWILIIGSILYGGLTFIGGVLQLKEREINLWSSIVMIIGGILVILSMVAYISRYNHGIYILIGGLVIIYVAGIDNGFKMYGKITPKHQITRLVFSALAIIIFSLR